MFGKKTKYTFGGKGNYICNNVIHFFPFVRPYCCTFAWNLGTILCITGVSCMPASVIAASSQHNFAD